MYENARWARLIASFLLLGLVIGHGWLTLSLFGPDEPWQRLLDDQPIMSGKHPQHLYLGFLGAQGLWSRGQSCVYDPSFQAGFPKTPVFNASRFAELCLMFTRGTYAPAAYKLGIALLCFGAPLFLLVGCRGAGMDAFTSLFVTASSLLIWWSPWTRQMLDAGDIDLPLAGLAAVAHTGLLVRFHRSPNFTSWLGLVTTGAIACFAQPLLLPLLLPILLLFYFCYGPRHAALTWHVALVGAGLASIAVNAFWLRDWVSYWWVRSPVPQYSSASLLQSWETFWHSPLWGTSADRIFALAFFGTGAVGLICMNERAYRPSARLFGLGMVGFLAMAVLGVSWEPLGEIGSSGWFLLALAFAIVPAGFFVSRIIVVTARPFGPWTRAYLSVACCAGLAIGGSQPWFASFWNQRMSLTPWRLGLDLEQAEAVDKLAHYTTPETRILWEDQPLNKHDSRWTALLPLLTQRSFIGALDADGAIEHSQVGFVNHALAGKPMTAWSGASLTEYCRRYNVGWVICRSPAALERLQSWRECELLSRFGNESRWHLFAIKQPSKSFALKGQARLIHSSAHDITLADVVPENGIIVLSMHYQTGLRASPARVEIEREPDATDPIGFIRLRMNGPAARVTLTWDGH